jgi:hypothetical protein
MSNTTLIIVIVVAVVLIAAIAIIGYRMAQQRRTAQLRQQYGPEYDRAIDQAESPREAESELRDRSKRHEQLELRSLDSSEREDFARRWSDVQGQFVDDPNDAVRNANLLVVEVMSARGYPVEDFGGRTDTPQTRDEGSSAAERLGGPLEGEQSRDRVSDGLRRSDASGQTETGADRQPDGGEGQRTTLIEPERAERYNGRWNELKSEFVDDPRRAVRGANQLVGEVLDELEELFRGQRANLEQGLDSEQTTTEDLRVALGRYRSFFDRLLSF